MPLPRRKRSPCQRPAIRSWLPPTALGSMVRRSAARHVVLAGASCRPARGGGRGIGPHSAGFLPSHTRCRGAHQAPERRTFQVMGRAAGDRMSQSIAHRGESSDRAVEFVGLVRQELPVDAWAMLGDEHARDLRERQSRGAPQRDQRQLLHHTWLEGAAQPMPASRRDQPLLFVEAQRRRRHAGDAHHLGNVDAFPLDFKFT